MSRKPTFELLYRYPQLCLKPQEGLKDTETYKSIVRKRFSPGTLNSRYISGSDNDSLTLFDTPAGKAEVLHLDNREDFKHFVRILAYKGEPKEIPDSMGAITIRGLTNRSGELISKDTLIITSNGGYSGIKDYKVIEKIVPEIDSYDKWISASRTIRTYHELTHFISRKMFINNKEAIRDEIIADAIGIMKAFGKYEPKLSYIFLGIEEDTYREGGRLQNYVTEKDNIIQTSKRARNIINIIQNGIKDIDYEPLRMVEYIEEQRIGIEN